MNTTQLKHKTERAKLTSVGWRGYYIVSTLGGS